MVVFIFDMVFWWDRMSFEEFIFFIFLFFGFLIFILFFFLLVILLFVFDDVLVVDRIEKFFFLVIIVGIF